MALNTSNRDAIIMRREMVASLRLRGLSLREIAQALAKQNPPVVNPKTLQPYDVATIKSDIDALKSIWAENANVSIDEHQSRQLAELQELKRFAWSSKNGALALRALETEMKLVGTYKSGVNITFNIELVTQVCALLEQKGIKPSDVFNNMIRELADA